MACNPECPMKSDCDQTKLEIMTQELDMGSTYWDEYSPNHKDLRIFRKEISNYCPLKDMIKLGIMKLSYKYGVVKKVSHTLKNSGISQKNLNNLTSDVSKN